MRKLILVLILLLLVVPCWAADKFVYKEATGSNNGTSWANAWNELSSVTGLAAGETLWISGGTSGETYSTTLTLDGNHATSGNRIYIRPGAAHPTLSSGHDGLVTISGTSNWAIAMFRNYYTLDGSANQTDGGTKKIAIVSNDGSAVTGTGKGTVVKNITINHAGTSAIASGVRLDLSEAGTTESFLGEVSYCYIGDPWYMGIWVSGPSDRQWGLILIHNNELVDFGGEDVIRADGSCDVYDNIIYGRRETHNPGYHADGIVTMGRYVRIFRNKIYDWDTADNNAQYYYPAPNNWVGEYGHVRVYNNLAVTNGVHVDPGPRCITFSVGASWAETTSVTDVYIVNNTCVNFGAGIQHRPRTTGGANITDIKLLNNLFYNVERHDFSGDEYFTYTMGHDSGNNVVFDNNIMHPGGPFTGDYVFWKSPSALTYSQFIATNSGELFLPNEAMGSSGYSDPNLDANYRPTASSTNVIGQGADLSGLSNMDASWPNDLDGNVRTSWDIGAYKYAGGGTFTSTGSGNWNDGATWGNTSPGVEGTDYPFPSGNTVVLGSGHWITIPGDYVHDKIFNTVFVGPDHIAAYPNDNHHATIWSAKSGFTFDTSIFKNVGIFSQYIPVNLTHNAFIYTLVDNTCIFVSLASGTIQGNYMYTEDINPQPIQNNTTGTGDFISIVSNIMEAPGDIGTDNDWAMFGGNAGRVYLRKNLFKIGGWVVNCLGTCPEEIRVEQNTYYNPSTATGVGWTLVQSHEGDGTFTGGLSFHSNLISTPNSVADPNNVRAIALGQTTADQVTFADYNNYHGANIVPYQNVNMTGKTYPTEGFGANDKTLNPQFRDPTRGLASWDTSLGGPGTSAHAIDEMVKMNGYGGTFDRNYKLGELLLYVRYGFFPQNKTLYKAGKDRRPVGATGPYHFSDWSYVTGHSYSACTDGPKTYHEDPLDDYWDFNPNKWSDCNNNLQNEYVDPDNIGEGQYTSVVNNPPAGSPTTNALKINWYHNDKLGTGTYAVKGTDGNVYNAKYDHTSSSDGVNGNRPITGPKWNNSCGPGSNDACWELSDLAYGRTFANADVWQDNYAYEARAGSGGNNSEIKLYAGIPNGGSPKQNIPKLPNPYYFQISYWADSMVDYAEAGRKFVYWASQASGPHNTMTEIYNTVQDVTGATNWDLPAPHWENKPGLHDETGFVVAFVGSANANDSTINTHTGYKVTGDPRYFGGTNQVASSWAPCPETGAMASDGKLSLNTWNTVECGIFQHATDGWVRCWLNGKMFINADKNSWAGVTREYRTLGNRYQKNGISITRSGNVATVTHTTHGLITNEMVQIDGTVEPEYRGWKRITVTDSDHYTYEVFGNPTTPATPQMGDQAYMTSHYGVDYYTDHITGIPSVRNGGIQKDMVEYFTNWIVSDSYIGGFSGEGGGPPPPGTPASGAVIRGGKIN